MTEPSPDPFRREEILDKPGIIGARWWHRSLQASDAAMTRRNALLAIGIGGGVIGLVAFAGAAGATATPSERQEQRPALDLQQELGWSFGATTEHLTFDGESKAPFDRNALSHLVDDVRPVATQNRPFFVPTLFQSIDAKPRSTAAEDLAPSAPLKGALTPIFTPRMDAAYRSGRALATLLQRVTDVAVIVDLPGPESVAFAAGAVSATQAFDPVFTFDNWPHPRGVVPAHLTLAAAAYYQPLFAKRAARSASSSTGSLPLFVLDRSRLAPYADDASQFDNRHLARLPDAAVLKRRGLTRILYVVPNGTTDQDLDDLNDELVLDARAGLEVRLVGEDAFLPDATVAPSSPTEDRPIFVYGGSAASSGWFFHDYAWAPLPPGAVAPTRTPSGPEWRPNPRVTPFSSGAPVTVGAGSMVRPRPPGFGTIPVAVSVATGLILGARFMRSGSWNRSSGGYGYGG